MAEFDQAYWESHWRPVASDDERRLPINPYLLAETAHLRGGTALDAGCGYGVEALWLAEQGWQVTAVDISRSALAVARARAATTPAGGRVDWREADLSRWEPGRRWDLVVTSYAHAEIGQLPLYQRIASWVAVGGTLLIVGHLPDPHHADAHGHRPPDGATVTSEAITDLFPAPEWRIDAAYERTRIVHPGVSAMQLHDVIVRAQRIA